MSYLKIGKYYGENIDMPTYQVKEVLDVDYLDITNVTHWFSLQTELGKDYLFCRSNATEYINTVGFDNLTQKDKKLSSENFCVDKSCRDTVLNDNEQEYCWSIFVQKSREARVLRWGKSKVYVSYRLQPEESNNLAVDTILLSERYVEYGIETFVTDGEVGLIDWLEGSNIYDDGSGFSSKGYYTEELKKGIIDRLNGLL